MRTWRRGSGLIVFRLSVPTRSSPAATMANCTSALFAHIALVGNIRDISLATLAKGDDTMEWNEPVAEREVVDAIAKQADASRVVYGCDLVCRTPGAPNVTITHGMTLWIEFADLGRPDEEAPLELRIALDVDMYCETTWGTDRDNRLVAELNAPLFNEFLHQVSKACEATVESVDAEDYVGQVGARGFIVSGSR